MLGLLWLIPAIPFASALALAVLRIPRKLVAWIAAGATAASAVVSLLVTISFLSAPPAANAYTQVLWTWFDVGGLRPEIAFYLDPISLIMTLVVAFVGFLIHLYSTEFMIDDEGYSRFFAYMNLFFASMLTLLLANNLLLLYLGWEGVGLCSYLLIGFWYRDPANGRAGRKAFIVTRIGDTALVIGLFLLFHDLGTLRIQELMQRATEHWPVGSSAALAAALLLLGGAVGKSAQLPLQTWLPDAMAGPTPVSALLHAATMVTAGVYLIARMHVLYSLAPAGAVRGRGDRRCNSFDCGLQRAHAMGYQTRAGLLHHEPDRLYVSGSWRGSMAGRYLPFHDACVLQGAAVSCGRHHHQRRRMTSTTSSAWAGYARVFRLPSGRS